MAGGDSSSMEFVATEREAEEEKGMNPLDPRFSEYDPKQRKYIYTRYFYRPKLDPKQRKYIYTRYFYRPKLDLDQESPLGPMRYTDRIFGEGFVLANSANVVSVKIVSSDYGYPLNVYGTIIASDSLDHKCVYVFKRGKDNCQLISSEDVSLILTGPKRGFMVCDAIFFEIDLKVKDVQGRKVKGERLSRGLVEVDAIMRLAYRPIHEVETETLVSMHSILDLSYTFIRKAVEGAVEVRILGGPADFHGKIYVCTTNVPCDIMLHDSKVNGILTTGDKGVVQMARSVVGVSLDELLRLTVAAALRGDEFSVRTVEFTPRRNSYDKEEITCGNYRILLKVTWAIIHL